MISDVDIRDWEKVDIANAKKELERISSNYGVGYQYVWDLLDQVEAIMKKQVPQVAVLLKNKREGWDG